MTKLSDLQCILLSTASAREDGSLYPQPASASHPAAGTAKAIKALLSRACVEEREISDEAQVHRVDADVRFDLYITPAGLAAIGVEGDPPGDEAEAPSDDVAPPTPAAKRETKSALLLSLLQRPGGATLPDLIAATGWLPHTVRAALTGLRKKGHAIERGKRDEVMLRHEDIDITGLAAREEVSDSWMTRVLRLAFLSPEVTAAIVRGRHKASLDSSRLLAAGAIAPLWSAQKDSLLGY